MLADALLHRHRARSAAVVSNRRSRLFLVPWRAAPARFVTWRTSRPPTEHALRAACLARLSARPTRDALHPTPLAEAPLAPTPRSVGGCGFEPSLPSRSRPVARGARALRHVENQPTAHRALVSARCVLGAVVCAANSRRAPPHAVGRGSSAPTPRSVGGCGFEPSLPSRSRPVARGARSASSRGEPADRPQSTCLCALRAWRGCLRGQLAARSTPRRWPRLLCTDTAPCRRLRLRTVVAVSFSSRGARRAQRFVTWRTSRPPTEHLSLRAACLARLSARPTRGALHPTPLAEAPLHRHRAVSAAAASNRRCRLVLVPWRAARARFVTWRTSRPPTEHLSLRAACLARLSAWPTRGALHPTPLAEAPLHRHRAVLAAAASNRRCRLVLVPWRAARARFVTWRTSRPPTEHLSLRAACLARLSAWPTRGALHPTPLAEAPLHRHRAVLAAAASNRRCRLVLVPWRAARARFVTWRTSRPPTEHLSLRAACLARLSAWPTRGALHPTPLAEAPLHRHRAVSAAAASNRRCRLVLVPWRAARARFVTWRTSRPPTEHLSLRAACLARLSAWPTRGALHPTPLAEAPLHRHRAVSAAAASNRRCRLVLVPWRAARARFVTWRTSRPPTEHLSLRAACLARLSAWPTRGALHPTPLAEAPLHRHRAVLAAAASNRRCRLVLVPWRAARARFVTWRTSRPPTEHLSLRAACLARLSAWPTRGALHPTPLAEAPLHRHRAVLAAAASNRRCRLVLVPWRAARARFVTWRTSRPPTEHLSLRAACLARLSAWPTRGALHPTPLAEAPLHRHRAGRRLRLRTVVAVSFSSRGARPARASSRGEPADRPRSTCLCALRAWRGCLRGQLAARSTPRRWPRLLCTDTAPVGGCGFEPSLLTRSRPVARGARALRHVENQPTAHGALVSARCVLGAVVCAANSRRAPPHAVGRGSSAQAR